MAKKPAKSKKEAPAVQDTKKKSAEKSTSKGNGVQDKKETAKVIRLPELERLEAQKKKDMKQLSVAAIVVAVVVAVILVIVLL